MVTIYTESELGHGEHGWLHARYHFSFSDYQNPNRAGLGNLLVINDDTVEPGQGFATHPHRNMEIITYVRKGAITHEDSNGNVGVTKAGDVQVMSAGSGIKHAEYNQEAEPTRLYQIWIKPKHAETEPSWNSCVFPKSVGELKTLVAGDGSAPLQIDQDAYIYAGKLAPGTKLHQQLQFKQAYILLAAGSISIDGANMSVNDGAEVKDQSSVAIEVLDTEAEIIIIDVK